jgi:hypothetical protein
MKKKGGHCWPLTCRLLTPHIRLSLLRQEPNETISAASPARRALALTEILISVLSHLFPGCNSLAEDDDEDDDDDEDELVIATAALRAVALVNRTWCACSLPLLWQRPSEDALQPDAAAPRARLLCQALKAAAADCLLC